MAKVIDAIFENGVIKPLEKLHIKSMKNWPLL